MKICFRKCCILNMFLWDHSHIGSLLLVSYPLCECWVILVLWILNWFSGCKWWPIDRSVSSHPLCRMHEGWFQTLQTHIKLPSMILTPSVNDEWYYFVVESIRSKPIPNLISTVFLLPLWMITDTVVESNWKSSPISMLSIFILPPFPTDEW